MAALHYLSTGAAPEAVAAYLKAGLAREAAMLAAARLLPGTALHAQAHAAWARSLQADGHMEHAAAAFLAGMLHTSSMFCPSVSPPR